MYMYVNVNAKKKKNVCQGMIFSVFLDDAIETCTSAKSNHEPCRAFLTNCARET